MNAIFALWTESASVPGTSLFLASGTLILGRSSTCDLVVRHDSVSRRHAEFFVSSEAVSVRDLASRNGTFIDNERIQEKTVEEDQYVRFGRVSFLLTKAGDGTEEPDSGIETARCHTPPPLLNGDRVDLTKAQHRVLKLLLLGLAEKMIAGKLHLSSTTIHNHIQAIYRIYKVHSRSELLVHLLGKNDGPPGTISRVIAEGKADRHDGQR